MNKSTKVLLFGFMSWMSVVSVSAQVNNTGCSETDRKANLNFVLKDINGNDVTLSDYRGKVILLDFWATWCAPCKKEMPSLDALYKNKDFKNLKIFAVNMEEPNQAKTKNFFSELNIEKLEIFFDSNLNFVKAFKLRGVPTTILINKNGEEFARIIGEINFQDKKFVKWLSKYD